MSFLLDVHEARGALVVAPAGVLDAVSVEVVADALVAQLDCGLRTLVLDLSRITDVVAPLAVHERLAALRRAAGARGAALRIDGAPPGLGVEAA